jgi:hypothetical protein
MLSVSLSPKVITLSGAYCIYRQGQGDLNHGDPKTTKKMVRRLVNKKAKKQKKKDFILQSSFLQHHAPRKKILAIHPLSLRALWISARTFFIKICIFFVNTKNFLPKKMN